MDSEDFYALTWHEDDVVHQAEGMLCLQLGTGIDAAVEALRLHAARAGLTVHQVAVGMVGRIGNN